jgi:prepilin-type processing-associated H-X9-DG protein
MGLAITTLILGILGLVMCPLAGIAAIMTGIVALTRISREPSRYGGRGMAIGGLVCGGASVVVGPMCIAILVTSLSQARELSKRIVCQANMKRIVTMSNLYATEYPGQGQDILDLAVKAGHLAEKELICPSSGLEVSNYVLVRYPAEGPPLESDAVIMYEPKSNHGGEGGNIVFADGHASFVRGAEYDRLIRKLPSGEP